MKTARFLNKSRLLRFAFILSTIVVLASMPIGSQTQSAGLPSNDDDIQRLIDKINEIRTITQFCANNDCPPLNEETAIKINTFLYDTKYLMKYEYAWLRFGTDTNRNQWRGIVESNIVTADRLAKLQWMIGVQEFVGNTFGTLLAIAETASSLQSLMTDPQKLNKLSPLQLANLFDNFYEGLKSLESGSETLRESQTGRQIPRLFNFDNDVINRHKSTFSDVKSIILEAHSNGGRETVKSRTAWRSVGLIIGRYSLAYLQDDIDERKKLADSYSNEISRSEKALADSFREYFRFQRRRNKAKDAYDALTQVTKDWALCASKFNPARVRHPGSQSPSTNIIIPADKEVTWSGENFESAVPTMRTKGQFREPIQYFDSLIRRQTLSFDPDSIKITKPSLSLKNNFF